MAVLPPTATKDEFRDYVTELYGPPAENEFNDLWARRVKLLSLNVSNGSGKRSVLPPEEHHLTKRERENKVVAEAKAAGRSIEKVSNSCWT